MPFLNRKHLLLDIYKFVSSNLKRVLLLFSKASNISVRVNQVSSVCKEYLQLFDWFGGNCTCSLLNQTQTPHTF